MPKIEIQQMTPQHIPILAQIDHNYQTNFAWQMKSQKTEEQLEIDFREIRLPRSIRVDYPHPPNFADPDWINQAFGLTAAHNGKPVGYIRLESHGAPKSIWVTDLAVELPSRRMGIASGLILSAQDWASQRGMKRIIIGMQSKNSPAIKLAQKLGYEFCGYNDHYYATQDIALFFALYLR
jgi:GNAT superfamily N-acetyltransferase